MDKVIEIKNLCVTAGRRYLRKISTGALKKADPVGVVRAKRLRQNGLSYQSWPAFANISRER